MRRRHECQPRLSGASGVRSGNEPIQSWGVDEPTALQRNGHWKMAVWALRVGFFAVVTILVGVIVLSSGGTPWVLAVGVICWLACAVVIAIGFLQALHDLPEPRPGFWSMRRMIIHDAVGLRVRTGAPR